MATSLQLFKEAICASGSHCRQCTRSRAWREALQSREDIEFPADWPARCPEGKWNATRAKSDAPRLPAHLHERIKSAIQQEAKLPKKDIERDGPVLWRELHIIPWEIPNLADFPAWLVKFNRRIKCSKCKEHWLNLIGSNPPPLHSREALWLWTVDMHNAVNRARGVDEWTPPPVENILITNGQCPGDTVMITAVVRDLHRAHPGRFRVAVHTTAPDLWEHNPGIVRRSELHRPRRIPINWTMANSNERYRHLAQVWADDLGQKLGVQIPLTDIRGNLFLTEGEKTRAVSDIIGADPGDGYWIVMAGGKSDAETKWWPTSFYQAVVDHFAGRVKFVQCGRREPNHYHQPLRGVVDAVGKTNARELMRLVYGAAGVLCPVTFAMHLAATIPTPDGTIRPCVVIAGGREPAHLISYPGHTVLHSIGQLPCSNKTGSCWKDKVRYRNATYNCCHQPVTIGSTYMPEGGFAKCMTLITPADVCRAIERYYEGGALKLAT